MHERHMSGEYTSFRTWRFFDGKFEDVVQVYIVAFWQLREVEEYVPPGGHVDVEIFHKSIAILYGIAITSRTAANGTPVFISLLRNRKQVGYQVA